MSGPIRLIGLFLAGIAMCTNAGCARHPRAASLRSEPLAGYAHTSEDLESVDSAAGKAIVGVESNSVARISTDRSGNREDGLEQQIDAASGAVVSNDHVAVGLFSTEGFEKPENPAKDPKPSINPLRGLFKWKEDSPQDQPSDSALAEEDSSKPGSLSNETDREAAEESKKRLGRSRGYRLLSMLGLGWGIEDEESQDEDGTGLDDSDASTDESLGEEPPGELADVSDAPDGDSAGNSDAVISDGKRNESSKDTGVAIGTTQPIRSIPPTMTSAVGVSNRAIQAVQVSPDSTLQRPPTRGEESGTAVDESLSGEQDDVSQPRHKVLRTTGVSPVDARRSARMAMRKAMLPGAVALPWETVDDFEENHDAGPPPAAVVQIPNRLPAPHVEAAPAPWSFESLWEWLPIGGLTLGGLTILGLGIWRRRGKRKEAELRLRQARAPLPTPQTDTLGA